MFYFPAPTATVTTHHEGNTGWNFERGGGGGETKKLSQMAPVGYTSVDSSIADDVSLSMDDRPSSSSLRLSTIDRPSSTTSTITSAIASEYWFIYQFE